MSGFSPEWLALREPADHSAINGMVRTACVRAFHGRELIRIVDLGCGTGSNLRALAPALASRQHWTLVDYDQHLLEVARARVPEAIAGCAADIDVTFRQADLARGELTPLIAGADIVTASALFDLVSVAVIDKLAAAVAAERCAFYTVLTYDGIAAFLPEHPADAAMRGAFNRHQQSDKGFGPAAGPAATDALAEAFARHGYMIRRGRSPWILDGASAQLRRELEQGWAAAVRETGLVADATIDDWLHHRLTAPGAVTIVGHEDILALPPLG